MIMQFPLCELWMEEGGGGSELIFFQYKKNYLNFSTCTATFLWNNSDASVKFLQNIRKITYKILFDYSKF